MIFLRKENFLQQGSFLSKGMVVWNDLEYWYSSAANPLFGGVRRVGASQTSMNRGPDLTSISSEVFEESGPIRFNDILEGVDGVSFLGSLLLTLMKECRDESGGPDQLRLVES